MSYSESVEKVMDVSKRLKEIHDILSGVPDQYWFEKMEGYVKGLFDRFCPFKVGDKVRLAHTPEINEKISWGWLGSKHFLVKGAVATVMAVDYVDQKFTFQLMFDDESWIPNITLLRFEGGNHPVGVPIPVPPKDRHTYYFHEDAIEADPSSVDESRHGSPT